MTPSIPFSLTITIVAAGTTDPHYVGLTATSVSSVANVNPAALSTLTSTGTPLSSGYVVMSTNSSLPSASFSFFVSAAYAMLRPVNVTATSPSPLFTVSPAWILLSQGACCSPGLAGTMFTVTAVAAPSVKTVNTLNLTLAVANGSDSLFTSLPPLTVSVTVIPMGGLSVPSTVLVPKGSSSLITISNSSQMVSPLTLTLKFVPSASALSVNVITIKPTKVTLPPNGQVSVAFENNGYATGPFGSISTAGSIQFTVVNSSMFVPPVSVQIQETNNAQLTAYPPVVQVNEGNAATFALSLTTGYLSPVEIYDSLGSFVTVFNPVTAGEVCHPCLAMHSTRVLIVFVPNSRIAFLSCFAW